MLKFFRNFGKIKYFGLASLGVYYYDVFTNSQIEYMCSKQNEHIVKAIPSLNTKFVPTFYLPTALLQLIYANKFDPEIFPLFRRQYIKLKDGGQIGIDWMKNKDTNKIVVLMHGITGGSDCNYIKDAMYRLWKAGFTVVCVNQRGIGYTKLLTTKYHNHADASDLKVALNTIQEQYPQASLYGVSFSMGSNLMFRYAGQEGENCKFKCIVSIANPFDFVVKINNESILEQKSEINIMKWYRYLYRLAVTENFKWLLRRHVDIMKDVKGIDIEKAMQAKSPYEFDDSFTKKLFNYESINTMYANNSCIELVKDIKVPVLNIHSKNDPIAIWQNVPSDINQEHIIYVFTQRGGHIEWFEGLIPSRIYKWIMKPTIEYLKYMSKS